MSLEFTDKLSGLTSHVIRMVHIKALTAVADISRPTIYPFYNGKRDITSYWILFWIAYSEKQIAKPVKNSNILESQIVYTK